jgi:hypothetical protein
VICGILRGKTEKETVQRRCRGRIVGVEVSQVLRESVDCLYPAHEERLNGVLRDRLNARTRKTHAFAKTAGTWEARVILCWFEHNGLRPHRALWEAGESLPEGRRERPHLPALSIPKGETTFSSNDRRWDGRHLPAVARIGPQSATGGERLASASLR